ERCDVLNRHQCRALYPAIRGRVMGEKFGRLALHMWTIDTTPLATALDAGMRNAQVLDLINKSGIPVGVLGVEYGWLFANGEESERLFKVFRESCENA